MTSAYRDCSAPSPDAIFEGLFLPESRAVIPSPRTTASCRALRSDKLRHPGPMKPRSVSPTPRELTNYEEIPGDVSRPGLSASRMEKNRSRHEKGCARQDADGMEEMDERSCEYVRRRRGRGRQNQARYYPGHIRWQKRHHAVFGRGGGVA